MANSPPTRRPKHTIILSHPDSESFCASVADRYRRTVEEFGHDLVMRDLYRMGFDPVLKSLERPTHPDFALFEDVAAELAAISGTDVFVLVYPIWFGTPPAMMKGYVDRVLGARFSHRAVESRQFHPIMSGKHLLSFTTSGASWAWLNEKAAWHALRQVFDHYLANAFRWRVSSMSIFPRLSGASRNGSCASTFCRSRKPHARYVRSFSRERTSETSLREEGRQRIADQAHRRRCLKGLARPILANVGSVKYQVRDNECIAHSAEPIATRAPEWEVGDRKSERES